jgi:ATP-binding cassette subfamily F protein uup
MTTVVYLCHLSMSSQVLLQTAEEKEKQKRLGGVVAEFKAARYMMGDRLLLQDFTYSFRQRDRIGIVGPNG